MPSKILSGWKNIANYLGKGVRTVQRYERELALPVRRPSGKKKGSVMVTRSELDAWIANRRFSLHSQFPVASMFSLYVSLKTRIVEIARVREQMTKLRVEIRASREMLRNSVRLVQDKVRSRTRLR